MLIKPTEATFCDYLEYNTDLDFTYPAQKWLYDYLDTTYNDNWVFDEEEITLYITEYTKDDFVDKFFNYNLHIENIMNENNTYCVDDLFLVLSDILRYNGKNVYELENGNVIVIDL